MDRHTLLALLNSRDRVLELGDMPAQLGRRAGAVQAVLVVEYAALAGSDDVQTSAEGTLAGARQHDGTHLRVDRQLVEDTLHLQPHGLVEGVELLRAVDLDVRDIGRRRGNVEVFVGRVSGERFGLGHDEGCGDARWLVLMEVEDGSCWRWSRTKDFAVGRCINLGCSKNGESQSQREFDYMIPGKT